MKVYQTSEIKNIALVGGAKSGKTTLAEAMAFESGLITRRGSVDDKNSLSDYREIEIDRKNSIISTILYAEHSGKKINIIDVPGFSDFQGELVASLNAVETAVVVINSQIGIEVGTEIAFKHTEKLEMPIMFAMNQLETEKSRFDEQIKEMKDFFGDKITIIQYPVNEGVGFDSFIDLITQKLYKYPAGGGVPQILEIPESEKETAAKLHLKLVENAAAGADDLMEKYFEQETLTIDEVRRGIKLGLASRSVFPVMCVSAKENMGVGRMLEFIANNVPSPNEAIATKTLVNGNKVSYDPTKPATLFIFKTSNEQHLGEIAYMKIVSGEVVEGMDVVNSKKESKERISQIFANYGKNRTKLDKAVAGDIISTIKLKDAKTNTTLTSPKNTSEVVTPIIFPEPIYTTAI